MITYSIPPGTKADFTCQTCFTKTLNAFMRVVDGRTVLLCSDCNKARNET